MCLTKQHHRTDLLWLTAGVLLLIGSGVGLRHPWPADEPGFVQVAREMVSHGNWLFPTMGGEFYDDKPPFYLWLLSAGYALTGSIRWTFLLPSLLAAWGIVALVYDLARRLHGRSQALASAALLLCTVQFVLQARSAQIDATLCFLTTLSLYALLRHLLLGPAWGWYFVSGVAAGLGVITKGVGFLPLLALLPFGYLRRQGFQPLPAFRGGWRWSLAGFGLLIGAGIWLAPMLAAVEASGDPALLAYRDAILVRETAIRYFDAWHHRHAWYYFIVEVIPLAWLPLSALLFWLVPRWNAAWRERDARVWLPLAWALIVLLFFSLSTGKRDLYILPALPAVALAAAPYLPELFARAGVLRLGAALAAVVVLVTAAFAIGDAADVRAIVGIVREGGLESSLAIASVPLACAAAALAAYALEPLYTWPATFLACALAFSWAIEPRIDAQRSGEAFTRAALAQVPADVELGLVGYKYQFLLYIERPVVDFGHRRWLDPLSEEDDAARWLDASRGRELLVPQSELEPCFERAPRETGGFTVGQRWWLVRAPASPACAARGDPQRVLHYTPPGMPSGAAPPAGAAAGSRRLAATGR
jgi:4-amino-4-deoxy-L-arabinose transferase-like glycosyltransferase